MTQIIDRSDNVRLAAKLKAMDIIKDFCSAMADGCRERSPVAAIKGGHNRDSIAWESSGLSGKVFSESGYGGWLEIGTSKMPARPYFRPAFEDTKQEFFK